MTQLTAIFFMQQFAIVFSFYALADNLMTAIYLTLLIVVIIVSYFIGQRRMSVSSKQIAANQGNLEEALQYKCNLLQTLIWTLHHAKIESLKIVMWIVLCVLAL